MKSFKTFLTEKWGRGSTMTINNRHDDAEQRKFHRKTVLHHHSKIGEHDVHIFFCKPNHLTGDEHHIDFTVDHSTNGTIKDKKTGRDVLHHVHKVVTNYVKKVKPNKITFSGNTSKKEKMYGHYAKKLAKVHNGEHYKGFAGAHVIKFKHGD